MGDKVLGGRESIPVKKLSEGIGDELLSKGVIINEYKKNPPTRGEIGGKFKADLKYRRKTYRTWKDRKRRLDQMETRLQRKEAR